MFLLSQSTHRMVVRYHPEVGHLYVPNLKARLPNENGGFYVVTNSEGFRSDSEFVRPRGDRPRILFLGDSFTAGDGCDNAQRFAEGVGQLLEAEVYNYAVAGTGTDQQLLIYEEFAKNMPADLIVFCIYVENIERIKVGFRESLDRFTGQRVLVPKPYFTLDNGQLNLHHVPVPLERPPADAVDASRFQAGQRADDPIQRLIYKPINRLRQNALLKSARQAVKSHLPWLMPAILKSTGFVPYPDYASSETVGWQLMQAILKRFCAAASPTPVLIVPIPTYYFYHDGIKPTYQPLFEQFNAPDRGIHVMDLTTPLYTLPWNEKKRIAFKHDTHFSPIGHQQVAKALAEQIRSRDLLPAPRGTTHRASSAGLARTTLSKPTYVLGISAFYHDSAAALIRDGQIVAAAEEERFSRVKNDRRFPGRAVNYCLEEAGIHQNDLAAVVYYDNAPLTFERLMHTLAAVGANGRDAWTRILPTWLQYKLHIPQLIRKQLSYDGLILQESHHRSHAASAFYPSPFERAAIVTSDGVGEWATGSIGLGDGRQVKLLKEMRFPNSLGLLYSAFTQFTGFKVNSGEYKMMGLAPYGEPKYVDLILRDIVDLKNDGSVELNMEYFAFLSQPTMTNEKFAAMFGGPARKPADWITQREMDIARSIQVVIEEAMLRTVRHAHELTGEKNLCLAGGVALNCVANGRLLREGPFKNIWIQPAAGDAGCALGAALDVYHTHFEKPRTMAANNASLQGGSYLGPAYSDIEIRSFLETHGYKHVHLDETARPMEIAKILAEGNVVGHFFGRLEFGPRSLGSRSILGDPRNEEMQQKLNLKIKYRESFRPFAPSVLAERARDYFDLDCESPYMLLVAPVREERRKPFQREGTDLTAIVRIPRSDVPAITHIDYSARIQTVTRRDHAAFYDLIRAFDQLTGCGVIVNTSFNVRGEPIICTPDDAYRCFMRTDMDYLVLGNFLLKKQEQPPWPEAKGHVEEDDVSVDETGDRESAFVQAISKVFDAEFLPLLKRIPRKAIGIVMSWRNSSSTWTDCKEPATTSGLLLIPPELDAASPDPVQMAEGITHFWRAGPATDALRPVVATLLSIRQKFPKPVGQDFEEKVSQNMYVMY